jgi:protein phosphatase
MGGHRYGEIASDLAVRSMANLLVRKVYMNSLNPHPTAPADAIQDLMRAGVQDAHRNILREAMGAGTTLTAALILGEQLTIAHVGDSRAYMLYADGELKALTRDHSLVRRLEEMGQITREEASTHPQRNVLYRALGQGEPFEAEVNSYPLPKGASLLLCSDGLWGVVEEKQLVAFIQKAESPQQACQQMVAAANEAGGPDNITVILVQLP